MWQRHQGKWHFIHKETRRVLATLQPVGNKLYRVVWADGVTSDIVNLSRARDAVLGRVGTP